MYPLVTRDTLLISTRVTPCVREHDANMGRRTTLAIFVGRDSTNTGNGSQIWTARLLDAVV